MSISRILIIDLDLNSCPVGNCEQPAKRICDFLPAIKIDIQTVTHLPPKTVSSSLDLILLRPSLDKNPLEIVQHLRRRWNLASILGLFCTERDTLVAVFQSLLNNLDDFLFCPFNALELSLRVQRFLLKKRSTFVPPQPAGRKVRFSCDTLVGESRSFLQVIEQIPKLAHSDAIVLISGETGTGKELVARVIHYQSPRQGKPFVPVNCGALPDHLVENELFGHERGAFTDASSVLIFADGEIFGPGFLRSRQLKED